MCRKVIGPRAGKPLERIAAVPVISVRREPGWIEFEVDEKAGLIRIYAMVWVG